MQRVSPAHVPSLDEKVAFLSSPGAYPDGPGRVDRIETHFAWVFLSRRFVYKLKKPIRFVNIDFSSVGARRANCELEITLNRRLAEAVYINVVPLALARSGLALEGDGMPVDWLVKMHRLPAEQMLDAAAVSGTVTEAQLSAVIGKLVQYYRRSARAPWDAVEYCRQLTQRTKRYAAQLQAAELGLDPGRIRRLATSLLANVDEASAQLGSRAAGGRVVDAHGDLRPEHVFLAENPQIIDCLEFSSELRLLDTAEEISFLALECERLGHAGLATRIQALYVAAAEDPAGAELFGFYRAGRALVRALLSAWHIPGASSAAEVQRWRGRAEWYLAAAEDSMGNARR
jgi:uncharacterized protein